MLQLDKICETACEIVKETGQFIHSQSNQVKAEDIQTKSKNNMVTYVDTTAEKRLVQGLQALVPEAGFITEEETIATVQSRYKWVIDPLDGTTNFLHGLPCYAISVALMEVKNHLLRRWL